MLHFRLFCEFDSIGLQYIVHLQVRMSPPHIWFHSSQQESRICDAEIFHQLKL